MSELKGQILGVVLVLAIFGSIAGIMVTLFKNTASGLETKVNSNIDSVLTSEDKKPTVESTMHKLGDIQF